METNRGVFSRDYSIEFLVGTSKSRSHPDTTYGQGKMGRKKQFTSIPGQLLSPRRELFCQHVDSGVPLAEAYVLAGYKPHAANPHTLRREPEIDRRVGELVAVRQARANRAGDRAIEGLAISLESLLAELEEARVLAMKLKQIGPAVSAIREKGVLSGLRVERSEQKQISDYDGMSLEELRRELLAQVAELGLPLLHGGVIEGEAVEANGEDRMEGDPHER
jgi:phage terminase small subunit